MHIRPSIFPLIASLAFSPASAADVDFAHEVVPILQKHCAKCHTNGTYKEGVSLDTREALLETGAVEVGDSSSSYLIDLVSSEDLETRMPPEGDALTAAEVDVLRRWIDADLPWEEGFTFRENTYDPPLKPRRPELPTMGGAANPVDRIVFRYWAEHDAKMPPLLDDAAFYRRASLDLVGLLPKPADVAAYVADRSPDKRALLVRRLLDDRVAYADHWLTFWNDLLRNDYAGAGYIDGGRKQITDWLYASLLANKPYDQFVRELIAPQSDAEGFAKGIVWRGQVNASQRPELQFAQNVGQVFLGVNLKCASCHDSFIDNWKLTDAYGLAAIVADSPLEIHRCDKPTGQQAKAYFLFPVLGAVDGAAPREARMTQLAALMTSPDNGRLTRTMVNRLWHRLMGRGIVHPVDSMAASPWSEDLLDYLAVHLSDSGYDLKKSLELIATSQVYAMQSVAIDESVPADEYHFAGPAPKRMTAEQFTDALTSLAAAQTDAPASEAFTKLIESIGPRPFVRASLIRSTSLMRTLGRPNREQVVSTRPAELTTLEALELSNGQALSDLLEAGARKLIGDEAKSPAAEQLCADLFRAAVQRDPTTDELARLTELAGNPVTVPGVADVLWCIVMTPEFQLVK